MISKTANSIHFTACAEMTKKSYESVIKCNRHRYRGSSLPDISIRGCMALPMAIRIATAKLVMVMRTVKHYNIVLPSHMLSIFIETSNPFITAGDCHMDLLLLQIYSVPQGEVGEAYIPAWLTWHDERGPESYQETFYGDFGRIWSLLRRRIIMWIWISNQFEHSISCDISFKTTASRTFSRICIKSLKKCPTLRPICCIAHCYYQALSQFQDIPYQISVYQIVPSQQTDHKCQTDLGTTGITCDVAKIVAFSTFKLVTSVPVARWYVISVEILEMVMAYLSHSDYYACGLVTAYCRCSYCIILRS